MKLEQVYEGESLNQIKDLYMMAFPKEERKPFEMICRLQQEGKAAVYAIGKEDGTFVGLGIFVLYRDLALLDYFAIAPEQRNKGLGSEALKLLQQVYSGRRFFLEIESVYEKMENNSAEKQIRIRRKQFYLKNGMHSMSYLIWLFGVEMEILTYGDTVSFEEYFELYANTVEPAWLSNVRYLRKIQE